MSIRRSPKAPSRRSWIVITLLAVLVACLGGSSRTDAAQITVLRPLAALFLVPALYYWSHDAMAKARAPLILLGALTLLMVVQLIPLPPSIWESLPGREAIAEMGRTLGQDDVWRPLSLVPARTLNALASLVVPIAALCGLIMLRTDQRTILYIITGLGIFNALLAIGQTASGGMAALYPYAITNAGTAVGIFANQNHGAVFAGLTLLIIGYLLACAINSHRSRQHKAVLVALFLLAMVAALTGGSRSGLLASFLALLSSAGMVWISLGGRRRGTEVLPPIFGRNFRPTWVLALAGVLVVTILSLFVVMERVPALNDLTQQDSFKDLRWLLLPTFEKMLRSYSIFGAGFGSFEEVFHIFEPQISMNSEYVNQAHNDWVQLVIEGGIAALALVVAAGWWFVRSLCRIGYGSKQAIVGQLFWLTLMLILLLASLVDYPLRTPIFQFSAAALAVALCRSAERS